MTRLEVLVVEVRARHDSVPPADEVVCRIATSLSDQMHRLSLGTDQRIRIPVMMLSGFSRGLGDMVLSGEIPASAVRGIEDLAGVAAELHAIADIFAEIHRLGRT